MPAHFDQLGISFQYPENWTLDEEEMEDLSEDNRAVTVYSPGGAFWSVAVYPRQTDPQKLVADAVEAMKQEYEQVEAVAARETVLDRDLIGYDFNFIYLDLISTAQIRGLICPNATYTIFCQAEDREFAALQKVFQAMTVSLLRGIE